MMFDLLCVTYFINKTSKFVLLFGRIHDSHRHTQTHTHALVAIVIVFRSTHTPTHWLPTLSPSQMGSICRAASLHVCATRTTVAVAPGNPPNGDGQRWLAARLCCRGHTHHRAEFGLFGPPAPFLLPLPPQLLLQQKWAVWGNAEADWITDKYFTPNCLSLVRARGRQGERDRGKGERGSNKPVKYVLWLHYGTVV